MTQGEWVAPGRVNIIGEHTDYNNGYALPIALPYVVHCRASSRPDTTIRLASQQHPGERVELDLADLAESPITGWARYALGVLDQFRRRGDTLGGLDLTIDGKVPVGAGLSSSAALECAVAVAVRDIAGIAIANEEIVALASAAENEYVGAPTGLLDQSASVLCVEGHALFLDFADGSTTQVPFDPAGAGLELLVIDTNTPHDLTGGEYGERRAQCNAAATALGVDSLRAITDVGALAHLDPILLRRARHIVSENLRVLEVVQILRSGNELRELGRVLSAGHASLRDDFEVSTIQLDTAVEVAVSSGAYGARMVGGGFGGSVIALVDAQRRAGIADAVAASFAASGFAEPRMFVALPSQGARRVN